MNFLKFIIFTTAIIGFTFSCSNAEEKSNSTSESSPTQVEKKIITPVEKEPTTDTSKDLADLKTKELADQKANELAAQKAKQEAEKKAKILEEKQAKELAILKAKGASEAEAKKLAEKQAKDLADLKAKELAAEKARELEDLKAKELADEKEKELIAQKAKELAVQKEKELAEQRAKELVEQKAKEEINNKTSIQPATEDAKTIIDKVDKNMISKSQIATTDMIIYGKRNSRTVRSKGYAKGDDQSFSEYLSPAKEKGTKMLKLKDKLWIYSPDTDRSIQLSGHMLKQSVMGSDLSYEDVMEDRKLMDLYDAKVIGEETIDGRLTWILELNAKVDDVSYEKRKMWIDKKRYVPLKEELYAKSGQLLKKTVMSDVVKIQGRWYPKKINYKDMLKSGKGTDFVIIDIEFDPDIPQYIFSKASLKK